MPSEIGNKHGEIRPDLADLSIALVVGLALTLTALLLFALPLSGNMAGSRDFISYWATGQLLAHRADPYNKPEVQKIEHAAGLVPKATLIMRNPPWAIPLVYPLGFLNVRLAATVWTLLLLVSLWISVHLVRKLHGSPHDIIHWLGLGFSPALICLIMGQTSLFALLGLCLFLQYHTSRPFISGLSLWFCLLKPQLFVPLFAVLLVWILVTRSYIIIAGTATAIAATSAIAWWIDPNVWSGYLRMMRSPAVTNEYIPCLSDAIRFTINPQMIWLQYLPSAVGCAWAVGYYLRRRESWNWTANSSPLLLISLLVAPYGWFYDQCLAIPAMMHGAYKTRIRWMLAILALMIALVDFEMCKVDILSSIYLWNLPVWLVWYLVAQATGENGCATMQHKCVTADEA